MKQCCRGPSENNRIQTDPVRRDLNMPAERELSYSVVFVLMSNLKHNPYGLVFFCNDAIYRKAYVVQKRNPGSIQTIAIVALHDKCFKPNE